MTLPLYDTFVHMQTRTRTNHILQWWLEWGGHSESTLPCPPHPLSYSSSSLSLSQCPLTAVADLLIIVLTCALFMVCGYLIGLMPAKDILAGLLVPFLLFAVIGMFVIWRRMAAGRPYRT